MRAIQSRFTPESTWERSASVVASARIERFKAGETLFSEGETATACTWCGVGSLTISRNIGGKEVVLPTCRPATTWARWR